MEEIQQKAIETYTKNLEYLQQNHNDLFNRINALSSFIDSGEYIERYHLEYIQEENAFDLYDTKTQTFVYNKQPNKFNKETLLNTNFDNKNSLSYYPSALYNKANKKELTGKSDEYKNTFLELSTLLTSFTNITTYDNAKIRYINKFIFINTLLGTHIPNLSKKLNAKLYFICEETLEIFRLSLFTTRYDTIAKNAKIIFSIMDDEKIFHNKIKQFLSNEFFSNFFIKYYSISKNNLFDRVLSSLNAFSPFGYSYPTMVNYLLKNSLQNINNYKIIDTNSSYTILNNQQVLLLAAGPSLEKNIQWIQKNRDSFFIAAIGAVVKTLISNNIKPDVILTADYQYEIIKAQFPDNIHDNIKSIPLLASLSTDNRILNLFNKENIFLFETSTTIKTNSKYLKGSSIGEISLQLLSILGADNIYLLGTDLAIDEETGHTHIQSHTFNQAMKNDDTFSVQGNFKQTVQTTYTFHTILKAYDHIVNDFSNHINIFNLSDGAYIQGTTPKHIDSVNLPTQEKIIIKQTLIDNSSTSLSKPEELRIKDSAVYIKKLLSDLSKHCDNKSSNNFQQMRVDFFTEIVNSSSKYDFIYLSKILINYLMIIEPYIDFCLNNKHSNKKEIITKMKTTWIKNTVALLEKLQKIIN